MLEDIPKVEPIDIPKYKYKNSKYEMMPSLPARMLCVASSTGGKSVLIQNLILKIYTTSFERTYIFSPSVHVDDTWRAVKKYISDVMKVDTEKEKVYYEEYDPIPLKHIIEKQHKVIDFQNCPKWARVLELCSYALRHLRDLGDREWQELGLSPFSTYRR